MFPYVGAHLCELNTNPANKVAHVMRLTYQRWCACPTDYRLDRLEYEIKWENDTALIALNVQYILHLKSLN